jgi:hypothetical protein
MREVQEILPPDWRATARAAEGQFGLRRSDEDSYEVTVNTIPWLRDASLDVALGLLDAQIRAFVALHAPEYIFVHAGVVARDGRALVIPGTSFSGKTTLVAALVRAGATYLSDEYAVLDAGGRVHPFARRLSIRGADGVPTRDQPVEELGGVAGRASLPVGSVLVTRYSRGADWQPRRLSAGAGALALLSNTIPAQQRPQASLRAVSRALADATVLRSDRGEATGVADLILDELAASAPR